MRRFTQHDFKIMPWRNGKGLTTELYRLDVNSNLAFRVSTATVEHSGPFSDFSGYDRTLINLGPGDMRLSLSGEGGHHLRALESLRFDGSLDVYCHVSAPSEDLNVFCRQEDFRAQTFVRKVAASESVPVVAGCGLLIYVLSGKLHAYQDDQQELALSPRELLLHEMGHSNNAPITLTKASDDDCVMVSICFNNGAIHPLR